MRRGMKGKGGRCLLACIWLASKARRWMNLAGKPHWRVFPSVVRQTRLQWLAISLHRLRRDVSMLEDNTEDNFGIYRLCHVNISIYIVSILFYVRITYNFWKSYSTLLRQVYVWKMSTASTLIILNDNFIHISFPHVSTNIIEKCIINFWKWYSLSVKTFINLHIIRACRLIILLNLKLGTIK